MNIVAISEFELELIAKILIAAVLGFLIGIERKGGEKGAGSRTFTLISVGATTFTKLGIGGFDMSAEPTRLAAQIITGVGFIGAGVIWKSEEKQSLHGLTTAAAIWTAAAMGISVGLGYFYSALSLTVIMMFILSRGHPVEKAKQNLGMVDSN